MQTGHQSGSNVPLGDRGEPDGEAGWRDQLGLRGCPGNGRLVFVVVVTGVLWSIVQFLLFRHDFRERPIVGDQASYVLQALSLFETNHDLAFDPKDGQQWRELGWEGQPKGLFFQRFRSGWGFAKPYLYSVWLGMYLGKFPPRIAIALAQGLLLALLLALSAGIASERVGKALGWLSAASLVFSSVVYYYAFVLHSELFIAVLVAALLIAHLRARAGSGVYLALEAIALGALLSERLLLLVPLVPIVCEGRLSRTKLRELGVVAGGAAIAFGVLVIPYLYYSDWKAITPYGGERYYSSGAVPWTEGDVALERNRSDYFASSAYLEGQIKGNWYEKGRSLGFFLVGRNTGLLVSIPIGFILVVLSATGIWTLDGFGRAALTGILLFIAIQVGMFPLNYYGGGQAIGNRYLVQIAPMFLPLLPTGNSRGVSRSVVLSFVLGVGLLWPHHLRPHWAFHELRSHSFMQQFLPLEINQRHVQYFVESAAPE